MQNIIRAKEKGFTLIELLIVIGIIGFLAAAVLVAVDPVKRIQDSRDARRFSEVNAVLNAILTKQVDDRGLHNGVTNAPIITSALYSQVIVSDASGIVCDDPATRPGCGVALDVDTANTNCVANLGGQLTGTADSLGTAITGTGTDFIPEVAVGDVLMASDGQECTVTVRTADDDITCAPAFSPVLADATLFNTSDAIVPGYIAEVPIDPRGEGESLCTSGSGCAVEGDLALGSQNSGYYIHRTNGNRIEIGACLGEQTTTINVKR